MGRGRGVTWRRATGRSDAAARAIRRAVTRRRRGERWQVVLDRLPALLAEIEAVAARGHDLEQRADQLDPAALEARLTTFRAQATERDDPAGDRGGDPAGDRGAGRGRELADAIVGVERDLERRRELINAAGAAAVALDAARQRLEDLARRLDDGHGLGRPEAVATDLDRLVVRLAEHR